MDLQVGRAQFADGLLEEIRWWILQTTDHMDAWHPDRPALLAAAVQVEWLRDQLRRLLGAVRGEAVDVGLSEAPPAPGRLRGRYASSLYQLHFLLGKVHVLVRRLSGDDGRAVGGWVDGFLGELQAWDGRLGEMPGESAVSIAVSILEPIDALKKWVGRLDAEDAAKELFPSQTAIEMYCMFHDEQQSSPALDWVRWMASTTSQYTMPSVSKPAHCMWADALLGAYEDLAVTIAADVAIDAADRDRLKVAAAYAAWLREGVQWDLARTAAASAPPWETPRVSPAQWPTTPPPPRPERLGQWYPALSGLRELTSEISWVRDRIWPNPPWKKGKGIGASDPLNLTNVVPLPPEMASRW